MKEEFLNRLKTLIPIFFCSPRAIDDDCLTRTSFVWRSRSMNLISTWRRMVFIEHKNPCVPKFRCKNFVFYKMLTNKKNKPPSQILSRSMPFFSIEKCSFFRWLIEHMFWLCTFYMKFSFVFKKLWSFFSLVVVAYKIQIFGCMWPPI